VPAMRGRMNLGSEVGPLEAALPHPPALGAPGAHLQGGEP
jgi:hypothetical protein